MAEFTESLSFKLINVMSQEWNGNEDAKEKALLSLLSEYKQGNDKQLSEVISVAVAEGVKEGMKPEIELTYEEKQQAMLKEMYPSLSEVKEVKEPDPDATLHQILYPNSYADMMKGKE